MLGDKRLILASKSPRRKQLLSQLGLPFSVMDVDINEAIHVGEPPGEYVVRVAEQKAMTAFNSFIEKGEQVESTFILAADTSIVFDRNVIGKPKNAKNGLEILRQLSGNVHRVLSAVCVWDSDGAQIRNRLNSTDVEFKRLSDREIHAYWRTGEPMGKAGGYAIQGLGAAFIKRIDGSYSSVMGLPLFETVELLADIGIDVMDYAN